MTDQVLKIADLELDIPRVKITRGNRAIKLRRKEWQLLLFLISNHGKVVTREMILDHVWSESCDVFPNVVSVHIKYLRDKIDKPFSKPLIKTVHGWGYKLEA